MTDRGANGQNFRAVLQRAPVAQDFFCDDLLEYIEEGRVIPVVVAELLTVTDGAGGEVSLQCVLAQKLAERRRVPADDCTGDDALLLRALHHG